MICFNLFYGEMSKDPYDIFNEIVSKSLIARDSNISYVQINCRIADRLFGIIVF
jgi:hypothetical protein